MCEFFYGGIAQLVRASALHAEGRRFESDYLHKRNRGLAQWLAQEAYTFKVNGSSPLLPTKCGCSTTVSASAFQAEDDSSILFTRSTKEETRCFKVLA